MPVLPRFLVSFLVSLLLASTAFAQEMEDVKIEVHPDADGVDMLTGQDGKNAGELTTSKMEQIVRKVTDAQNQATRRGVTLADVERLYAMYTDDFVYEHPGMNDTYTRDELYANHVRLVEAGGFESSDPEASAYRIVSIMHGTNASAVHRISPAMGDGPPRMAVFEFRGDKVSRIREYWNY